LYSLPDVRFADDTTLLARSIGYLFCLPNVNQVNQASDKGMALNSAAPEREFSVLSEIDNYSVKLCFGSHHPDADPMCAPQTIGRQINQRATDVWMVEITILIVHTY